MMHVSQCIITSESMIQSDFSTFFKREVLFSLFFFCQQQPAAED